MQPMTGPGVIEHRLDSPDEAEAFYEAHYRDLKVKNVDGQLRMHARMRAWSDLIVTRLSTEATVSITDVTDREDFIVFDLASGHYRYRTRREDMRIATGDVMLFPQRGDPEITIDGMNHRLISVKPKIMHDVVKAHTDREKVRFTGTLPISSIAVRHYIRVASILERLSIDDGQEYSPIIVGEAARGVAATVLTTFPNDALADPKPVRHRPASNRSLARAVEYISSNFLRDISVADIAEAARVTPRALSFSFRARFDMSPGEYLRRVRLDWAHQELRKADPKTTKISAIARRTGYSNDSSFAKAYRAQFDVLPSHTLNRRDS